MTLAVGFDVGGSTVRAGLVALEEEGYRLLDHRRELLDPNDKRPETLVRIIERLFAVLIEQSGNRQAVAHLGIGLPGVMTDSGRVVVSAPNLAWQNVALADLLERALSGVTIRIDNDLNVILLGEQRFGAAAGFQNVVAVFPGTGIGGAVMIDGRLVRGSHGFAGEIGHIFCRGEIPCGCGKVGCVETIAGGRYIEARVAADQQSGRLDERHFPPADRLRVDDVDRAYAAGDEYAIGLWNEVSAELARLAATAVALLDPELVLLGGGVIEHAPRLRDRLLEEIPSYSPLVYRQSLRVAVSTLGLKAGVLGAAFLATSTW